MGETLTKHLRKNRTAPLVAGGLLVCASIFASPAARADDSLWNKALSTVGLGGAGDNSNASSSPQAAPAPQPAAPAPKPQPTRSKRSASASNATDNSPATVAPTAAAPVNAAPAGSSVQAAAASEQSPNLWRDWFGVGRDNGSSSAQASAPAQSVAMQQKAINPVAAPANPPAPPAPGPSSSMWDNMLGSIGLNANNPASNVNYNERPKLAVPKERKLPEPNAAPEPGATRAANSETLTKPPGDYLEKVKGADGNVSGLRDSDISKDKKLFGLFSFGQDDGAASSYSGVGMSHAH